MVGHSIGGAESAWLGAQHAAREFSRDEDAAPAPRAGVGPEIVRGVTHPGLDKISVPALLLFAQVDHASKVYRWPDEMDTETRAKGRGGVQGERRDPRGAP